MKLIKKSTYRQQHLCDNAAIVGNLKCITPLKIRQAD